MTLQILQWTGQPWGKKNYPTQNVNCVKNERTCSRYHLLPALFIFGAKRLLPICLKSTHKSWKNSSPLNKGVGNRYTLLMETECHHPHAMKEQHITIHSSRKIKLKFSQFTSFWFICKLQCTKNGRHWQVNYSYSSGPAAQSKCWGITEQGKGITQGQPAPCVWGHQCPRVLGETDNVIHVLNVCRFDSSYLK